MINTTTVYISMNPVHEINNYFLSIHCYIIYYLCKIVRIPHIYPFINLLDNFNFKIFTILISRTAIIFPETVSISP